MRAESVFGAGAGTATGTGAGTGGKAADGMRAGTTTGTGAASAYRVCRCVFTHQGGSLLTCELSIRRVACPKA